MDLRFVTSNPGKVREARTAFAPYGIRIRPVRRELAEPQTDSLREVVRAKLADLPRSEGFEMVEDSGLFLDGLSGFPGVYSAYAYRTVGLVGILRLLRGRDRRATFRTVAGLRRGNQTWLFEGEAIGTIAARPTGGLGFGFDPIFRPSGSRGTFAGMAPIEKLRVSHRGRAFRCVAEFLVGRDGKGTRPREGGGKRLRPEPRRGV